MNNRFSRDYLVPPSELIKQLSDLTDRLEDPESDYALEIERVNVELPLELNIAVDDEGTITFHGSAPTQTTETTILPVFHRLSLQIVPDDGQ